MSPRTDATVVPNCAGCGNEFWIQPPENRTMYLITAWFDTCCPYCGLPHYDDGRPLFVNRGVTVRDLNGRDTTMFCDGESWHSFDHVVGPTGNVTLLINDNRLCELPGAAPS